MLIPGPDEYLEFRMLDTSISATAYGIVIVLSGNCFLLLLKKRGIYSNRMRLFLLIYVTVMLLLSTLAIILSTLGITFVIFRVVYLPLFVSLPLLNVYSPTALPLTIWGADGFMVSIILFHPNKHFHSIATTDMALCCLVSGRSRGPQDSCHCPALTPLTHFVRYVKFFLHFLYFHLLMKHKRAMMFLSLTTDDILAMVLILFSTFVNIILAVLIILRLIHHQRHIRKVLGAQHGSPYSKIITMCVESSALIVNFSGVYIVLALEEGNGSLIPFLLLPHICVSGLESYDI